MLKSPGTEQGTAVYKVNTERQFGLTGNEGNHSENVKEDYFYLDSTAKHSYMKYLNKYPQAAYPYTQLAQENRRRDKSQPQFELLDTGVFEQGRHFDVVVEYAKSDICLPCLEEK